MIENRIEGGWNEPRSPPNCLGELLLNLSFFICKIMIPHHKNLKHKNEIINVKAILNFKATNILKLLFSLKRF